HHADKLILEEGFDPMSFQQTLEQICPDNRSGINDAEIGMHGVLIQRLTSERRTSLLVQYRDRIDLCRPTRGQTTGGNSNHSQCHNYHPSYEWIQCTEPVNLCLKRASQRDNAAGTKKDAACDKEHTLPQDQGENSAGRTSQSDPYSDFTRALRHKVRKHA